MPGKRDVPDASITDVMQADSAVRRIERVRVVVAAGPDAGREVVLGAGTHTVGKAPSCELPLTDGAVSRRHLELVLTDDAVRVRDLGSTNGSFYQGARFHTIEVGVGAVVTIGQTELQFERVGDARRPPRALTVERFGDLVGASAAMRQVFSILERVAASDAAVLVTGETGTGKELVAEAIHHASGRRRGPFVICDLASLPRTLIESELFGHVRGAFTGADRDRQGAFEASEGGTLFLDEVGELELEVQPRLLRALERRQIKRVGTPAFRTVDARVIAASNRDLAADVKAGRFREDLYHRLAVVCIHIPPLRERRDDIPKLVTHFLEHAAGGRTPPAVTPDTMAALQAHDWPGNVRELRNVLERAMSLATSTRVLDAALLGLDDPALRADTSGLPVDTTLPFKESKDRLIQSWEREYLTALLDRAQGNVSLAARRGGLDRVYLHRLMKKHGLGG